MVELFFGDAEASSLGVMSELGLASLVLGVDCPVRLTSRHDFEEAVHRFERDALGLRHDEVDPEDRKNHHGCEEIIDAATGWAHVRKHLGRKASDDETRKIPSAEVNKLRNMPFRSYSSTQKVCELGG